MQFILILISFLFLSSCTPVTEIDFLKIGRSATPTPEHTQSLVDIKGRLFFDMNGSGLQDIATAQKTEYFKEIPIDDYGYPFEHARPELQQVINFIDETSLDADLISIQEPGLYSGLQVCISSLGCVQPDRNGYFTFKDTAFTQGEEIKIEIKDENAAIPELALRFINQWKGSLTIAAHQANGIQIPEQHLNNTEFISISDGVDIIAGEKNHIGLTQGIYVLELGKEEFGSYSGLMGYDHDTRINRVMGYNSVSRDAEKFDEQDNVIYDGHRGVDRNIPLGTFIRAPIGGVVEHIPGSIPDENQIRIRTTREITGYTMPQYADYGTVIDLGHLSEVLIQNNQEVKTGQIIALSGMGISTWEHLHSNYYFGSVKHAMDDWSNNPLGKDAYALLPETVEYLREKVPDFQIDDMEMFSAFTVYNIPQLPDTD
jgi:murein DD-endopeptidase MepM/ murein hydrolase activator NlpD